MPAWKNNILTAAMVLSGIALAANVAGAESRTVEGAFWYLVDHIDQQHEAAEMTVWMSMPVDRPGQDVTIGGIEPKPREEIDSSGGENHYLVWEVKAKGSESLLMGFDFTVELSPIETAVDPELIEPWDREGRIFRTYTLSEFGIETEGPVADLAAEIVGDEVNPWRRARLIFDWMIANMVFVPGGEGENRAQTVCLTRRGDCGQYSLLFCALCRSVGIPARPVTGEMLTGGMHRWAEFHIPPYGWIPADPAAAQALVPGATMLDENESRLFGEKLGIPDNDPGWLFGNIFRDCLVTFVGNHALPSAGALRQPAATLRGLDEAAPLAVKLSGFNHDIAHGGFFLFGEGSQDPERARDAAYQRLASSYFDAGLFAEIEDSCLKAVVSEPDVVSAWMNLGRVYMSKREFRKAESSFNRALLGVSNNRREKAENLVWVRNYLGNCYDMLGFRELALEQYQTVIDSDINYRGARDYARRYRKKPFSDDDF